MMKAPYKLFFSTLGNKTRLEILFSLREGKKNVSNITRELGCDQTTVSHNLKRLTRCGFVRFEKMGKERFYSINEETIHKIFRIIDKHTNMYCRHLVGKEE